MTIFFDDIEKYQLPSVNFQSRMEEASLAIDKARGAIDEVRDHLSVYRNAYAEMLRDIPDQSGHPLNGKWIKAHETATMQMRRIEHVMKLAKDLDDLGYTMGDDVLCLKWSLPENKFPIVTNGPPDKVESERPPIITSDGLHVQIFRSSTWDEVDEAIREYREEHPSLYDASIPLSVVSS